MSIAIIDYGSGNLRSAQKAFAHMAQAQDGRDVVLTRAPERIAAAEHIVLPGVGAFGDCAAGLRGIAGMVEALDQAVRHKGRPFLGICVGMQLMAEKGFERGTHDGLGWLPAQVHALDVPGDLKVPHMGWNNISVTQAHPALTGLDGADMYFVHSYGVQAQPADIVATCTYGRPFPAIVARDNMLGTQFHPEKSQQAGLHLIRNFLAWRP